MYGLAIRPVPAPLIVTPEDGAYAVDVPALPGRHNFGDTLVEAIENAEEAIRLYREVLKDKGESIPEETQHPQAIVVEIAA